MALTKNIIRGSTITLVEQGIKLAIMFVTTPLMVKFLGEEKYGTWLVALALIGYLKFLDLGVSFSGTRFLGQAIGSHDHERFRQISKTLCYLYNRIGLLAAIATIIVGLILPAWLPEDSLIIQTRWILIGLGFTTTLRFWTRIFEITLKSHVRYDLIGLTSIVKSIIQGALVIFLLTSGYGLNALLLSFILSDIIDQLLLCIFARRVYPEAKTLIVRNRPSETLDLVKFSATATFTSLGSTLRGGIDPLIVGKFSGLEMVPIYSIGARFLTIFTDAINAIFGGNFLAAFSQLDGRNDREALVQSFLKSLRFSAALTTCGASALAILGPPFIERWIGTGFEDSGQVLLILLFPTSLLLIQYPIWGFFYSQNKQHWLAWLTFGGGLFNVILSILLSLKFGFFGVVWATFIEMIFVFGISVPILASRLCKTSLFSYWNGIVSGLLPAATVGILYYMLTRNWLEPNYGSLTLQASCLVLLQLPTLWIFTMTTDDRRHLKKRFHQ